MGYITLAFDASHYGESGGEPRYKEVPGASHVDLYDKPEHMKVTLKKLDSFFKKDLN